MTVHQGQVNVAAWLVRRHGVFVNLKTGLSSILVFLRACADGRIKTSTDFTPKGRSKRENPKMHLIQVCPGC